MKRKITGILFVLIMFVLAFTLTACASVTNGVDGIDGINGINGIDGINGADGIDGKDGQNGKDGLSAYDIWLNNGYEGTEADFLQWLKGDNGLNGADGLNGTNGKDGLNGINGVDGIDGIDGKDGANGADGVDGIDGKDGLSAYEIYLKYNPDYLGTEEQWINALVSGELVRRTITFKAKNSADVVKTVFHGFALTDIPAVPARDGQISAAWDTSDFSCITSNLMVNAVYEMQQYNVTFHNDYTDEDDIVITLDYDDTLTNVPEVANKIGNTGIWSVTDFDGVKEDITVYAIYETNGLEYRGSTYINGKSVSSGNIDENIKELFIPSEYDGIAVRNIGRYAFENLPYLERVYLPDSLIRFSCDAFNGCAKLISLNIPSSVTTVISCSKIVQSDEHSMGNFKGCTDLTELTVSPENTVYYSKGNCIIENATQTVIAGFANSVIPTDEQDMIIGRTAFAYSDLSDFIIPGNVTIIESYAFMHSNVESVNICYGVTQIGVAAFYECESLNNVSIANSVTVINKLVFGLCSSLTEVTIPESVIFMDLSVFWYCTNLKSAKIDYKKIPGSTFAFCSSLENVILANDTTSIDGASFLNCTSLKSIVLPNSVTVVANRAFDGCTGLETVYFKGTLQEFQSITVASANSGFFDAAVYFYSETEPTDSGDYWHYDSDGITPVIWNKKED